ncbi:hypothetical protein V1L54_26275 [Streptomyces sp. TRM 70361]|uniref:morphogenic membrane protein MmpA n=1 Tax=Streptomyces sp. TRM 70361 TaxID=3116553 RepID=UPI002E7B25F8|nr:hypothetical protein [Streptomyces sp. TRM 70361]MEE1942876.1 hypothetical protein [Streptomyces sp. TRM 70361]
MERIMENTHVHPEMTTAVPFGAGRRGLERGLTVAFALAGTLAVAWLVGMVYVIGSWALGG